MKPCKTRSTVTIVQIVAGASRRVELSMIDVAVAAFGLTGVIMVAAIVAGIYGGRRCSSGTARAAPSRASRRAATSTTCFGLRL